MSQNIKINVLKEFMNRYGSKNMFANIVCLGAGGTGSYVIQQVAQMLSIFNIKSRFIIADHDIFEEKNKKNQLILDKDVGERKAKVLAKRYSGAFQVDIGYYDKEYVEDVETLKSLFQYTEYGNTFNYFEFPILLGCVDNNFTRQIAHEFFNQSENLLYIDSGIESVKVPEGKSINDFSNWSKDETESFKSSGFTGQIVAGLRLHNETVVEPLADLFPNVLEDDDTIAPSEAACSSIVSSHPERVINNRLAAQCMCNYLNEFFDSGSLSNNITYFHSKRNMVRSVPITME